MFKKSALSLCLASAVLTLTACGGGHSSGFSNHAPTLNGSSTDNANEAAKAEEERKKAEEAAKAEEERKKAEEAAKAEEERKKAEEAAKAEEERKKAEEAAKAEEERKKAEEAAKAEEERKKAEEAAKAEEERKKAEEAAKAEEERKKAEEAAKAEEERKKAEEAAKAEEERKKAEEAAKAEEERKKAEEAAKAEEERKKAEEAAQQTNDPTTTLTLTQDEVRKIAQAGGKFSEDRTVPVSSVKSDYKVQFGTNDQEFSAIDSDSNPEMKPNSGGKYSLLDGAFKANEISTKPVKMVENFTSTDDKKIKVYSNVYAYHQNYSIVGLTDVESYASNSNTTTSCYYCSKTFILGNKTNASQLQAKIDGNVNAVYKGNALRFTEDYRGISAKAGNLTYTMNFGSGIGSGLLSGFDGLEDVILKNSNKLSATDNKITGNANRDKEDDFYYSLSFFGPHAEEISGTAVSKDTLSDNERYIFGGQEQK